MGVTKWATQACTIPARKCWVRKKAEDRETAWAVKLNYFHSVYARGRSPWTLHASSPLSPLPPSYGAQKLALVTIYVSYVSHTQNTAHAMKT
jgi:hypothetical protein